MEKSKLILKDGTAIPLEAGSSLGQVKALYGDWEALTEHWEKLTLTPQNLAEAQVKNGDTVTGEYENLTLGNPALQVDILADGTLSASWGIREKTQMELLSDQVDANTEAIEVHDGAIGDLAEATSALAEQAGEVS